MPLINWKQLGHATFIFSRVVIPFRPFKREVLNVVTSLVTVAALIVGMFALNNWSPFPPRDTVYFQSGALIGDGGVNLLIARIKLGVFLLVIITIVTSFLVDIRDSITNQTSRFLFRGSADPGEQVWWSVVLLFVGYLARIWIFSVASIFGLQGANLVSVVKTGVPVFRGGSPPSFEIGSVLFAAIQNPLATWSEGPGGSWESLLFVMVLGVGRWLILTFLLGVFYLIIPHLAQTSHPRVA
jgi:hypothetical protein